MIRVFQFVTIAAGLFALQAVGGAAPASAHDPAPPFSCKIRSEETRTGVHMEATLTATRSVDGRYSLKIQSKRAGMNLSLQQAGEFTAAPGAPALLGSATLSGNAEDYDAELHIVWDGRTYGCRVLEREV